MFKSARRSLSMCPTCDRDFILAVGYEPYGEARWWMSLRCANCATNLELVASDAEVERFLEQRDQQMFHLTLDADRLNRMRFEREIDTLTTALDLDLLTADDFR